MNGQQIVDTCESIAARQFSENRLGAALYEITLLRTKVLELARRVNDADQATETTTGSVS